MTATIQEVWAGDAAGKFVADWSLIMHNTGFSKMETEMAKMLELRAWQDFTDGLGHWKFLPGEFDYFLSSQDIKRDYVIHGMRDIKVKAAMEKAMDERRTGEVGYRRDLTKARQENPSGLGTQIEPYGYLKSDRPHMEEAGVVSSGKRRDALGSAVRRYNRTGGQSANPRTYATPFARLQAGAMRLSDQDLETLITALTAEQARRGEAFTKSLADSPTDRTEADQ